MNGSDRKSKKLLSMRIGFMYDKGESVKRKTFSIYSQPSRGDLLIYVSAYEVD